MSTWVGSGSSPQLYTIGFSLNRQIHWWVSFPSVWPGQRRNLRINVSESLVQHEADYHLYLLVLSRYIYHTWLVSWCSPAVSRPQSRSSNKAVTLIFEATEKCPSWKMVQADNVVYCSILYTASVFGIYGDLSGICRFNYFENVYYFNVFRIDFKSLWSSSPGLDLIF